MKPSVIRRALLRVSAQYAADYPAVCAAATNERPGAYLHRLCGALELIAGDPAALERLRLALDSVPTAEERVYAMYADDVPDPANAVHVSIEFRTPAGSPACWSRWTQGPDQTAALEDATEHVRKFKRCAKIDGGSAAARSCRVSA